MSSEEERLYARAEMLEETGELAQAVSDVLAGAQGARRRPAGRHQPDRGPADPGSRRRASYTAGGRKHRQDGSGYGSDGEFLEALSDAEDQVREHLREVTELREQVSLALGRAERDLGQARRDLEAARGALAAAYAMGTRQPCDGCHSACASAIAAAEAAIAGAEARIADTERRIGICEAAADILEPLAERLARALAQLRTSAPGPRRGLPADLRVRPRRGETAAIWTLDRRGPHARPAGSPATTSCARPSLA